MLDPSYTSHRRSNLLSEEGLQRPELKVLLAAPRGFCAGVRRAIDGVRDALAMYGPPVYVRRPIVHNLEVVRELESEGAIFVEELDDVPDGAVVLFSAHGVAPSVAREAKIRGLKSFDAVCPLVSKVHREVERHHRAGRQIIIIGHLGHPEIEGTLGHLPRNAAFVVKSIDEVGALPLRGDEPAAYAIQTTYSVTDAAAIVEALRDRFSDLAGPASSDICYATTNRQAATVAIAGKVDVLIVAGESFSSNACRLAEVASRSCGSVQLVASAAELDWSKLNDKESVGITAAASTPESTVASIIDALAARYNLQVEEFGQVTEPTVFRRMAVV